MADPGAPALHPFGRWPRRRRDARRCLRCGRELPRAGWRRLGARPYCGEACALVALLEDARQAAWARAELAMEAGPRTLRRRVLGGRLAVRAARLQRRLHRHLEAGPCAGRGLWAAMSRRCALATLLVVLAALGAASGRARESRAMAPERVARPPAPLALPVPAPPAPAPVPLPVRPLAAGDFTRGDRAMPEMALTFDGHDQANVAGEILDILRPRGVRTTFFLTGQFIRLFPDLVRRMVDEGHEIANHLDSHPHLTSYARNRRHQTLPGVTRAFLLGELERAEASFRALAGRGMAPYWRAPYGEHNAEIRAWAEEAGYRHVGWTRAADAAEDLDTRDWVADTSSRIYRSREEIAGRILAFGGDRPGGLNGGIVLMHLNTHRQADRPHEALPDLLPRLQERGYRLVTVSQLVARAGAPRANLRPPAGLQARVR